MNHLDKFDLILLRELERDCRQSAEQLMKFVALSPTAIQRRIKRLRDERIIVAERAIVDPKAMGRKLTLLVMVTLKVGRSHINDHFKQSVREAEEVQMCYAVTGDHDFLLTIHVRDMEEYDALTHRLFHRNDSILKFQTMVVMETVKADL